MVEQALLVTQIPDYPIAPGDIDTSEVDPFFKISTAQDNRLNLGIAARRFIQLAQETGNWGPFTADQLSNHFESVGLKHRFLGSLFSSGSLVCEVAGYHPTLEFVERAAQVAPIQAP